MCNFIFASWIYKIIFDGLFVQENIWKIKLKKKNNNIVSHDDINGDESSSNNTIIYNALD